MRPLFRSSLRAVVFTSSLALPALAGCAASTTPGADIGPGIHTGKVARFAAHHDFTIEVPEGAGQVRAWFARPNPNDRMQKVSDWHVTVTPEFPHGLGSATDQYGNEYLYLESEAPPAGTIRVDTSFTVKRYEMKASVDPARTRPHTEAELAALGRYLQDSSQSGADDAIRAMAASAVGDERNPIRAARAIYDAVLERVDYHVKDPKPDAEKTMKSTGVGNAALCYASCTGNCTDFHSLYAAAARSVGLPTRAVYGSFFKGPLDGQDKDQSYHCWLEVHAPGIGWVPLDVAVADVFVAGFQANEHSRRRANLTVANGYQGPDPALVDYYFGNLEERRVSWHWGRDLVLEPRQAGNPLLWNPKAHVEIDGRQAPAGALNRKLTYRELR